MLSLYIKAKDLLHRIHADDTAQDVFEYLLIVGGVSVIAVAAIALGVAPAGGGGLVGDVIGYVDTAIQTVV